jgi:hypothetical protein
MEVFILKEKSKLVKQSNPVAIPKVFIVVVLALFSVLTAVAVVQYGFMGIFAQAFQNFATIQVFVDLFIASSLIMVWMWFDAKENGRMFWPWALVTLAIGSFGPLLYLLVGKRRG